MFKRLGKALGGASAKGSGAVRVRFDLQVVQVERLPQAVRKCRVVWARNAKVQVTAFKEARNGTASFKQTLQQVTTLHRDRSGDFESKEYTIKVQVPESGSDDSIITVGKVNIDLARFVGDAASTQNHTLPVTFKVGTTSTGAIKLIITATPLGEMSEDGLTEVSGMTGLTSEGGREQDLEGFDDHGSNSASRKGAGKGKGASQDTTSSKGKASARKPGGLPPTQEESEEEDAQGSQNARGGKAAKNGTGASRAASSSADPFSKRTDGSKPPPRPTWDDDDISPVESDLASDNEDARPAKKDTTRPPPKPAPTEPAPDLTDMKASLFGKKKSGSGEIPAPSAVRPGGNSEDSARGSISFDLNKSTVAASKARAVSASRLSRGTTPAVPEDLDEDEVRGALFAAPSKSRGSKAAPAPPSVFTRGAAAANQDEEPARGSPVVKGSLSKGSKAVPTSDSKPSKAQASSGWQDFGDEEAPFAAPTKTRAAQDVGKARVPVTSSEETKSGRKPFQQSASPRVMQDDGTDEEEAAALGVAAAVPFAASLPRRPTSTPSDTDTRKLNSENDQLRQQVQQLQQREAQLTKQVDAATAHVHELEDRLAEADVAALYSQMQEMETKHGQEMQLVHDQYEAQIAKLHEQLEQLQEELAAGQKGAAVAGVSAVALAEREALLSKLEAEARGKVADANRMVDESMLVAVKSRQDKQALQSEITRLNLALTASSSGFSGSQRLLEEVEELQAQNEELRQGAAAAARGNGSRSRRFGSAAAREREEAGDDSDEEVGFGTARKARVKSTTAAETAAAAAAGVIAALQRDLKELRAKCEKLEGICEDLERDGAAERSDLEAQIKALQQELLEAQTQLSTLRSNRKRAEDDLAQGQSSNADPSQFKAQMTELEVRVARLGRENLRLAQQVQEESGLRQALEQQVKHGLEDMGDDEAIEAVEAFENKYLKLKDRYKKLEVAAGEEADDLQAQLVAAQQELGALKQQGAAAATGRGMSLTAPARGGAEVAELRRENNAIVQQLVAKQLEVAELAEEQVKLKRDLHRAKEFNLKLATKMTKLEAQVYSAKGAKDVKGKSPAKGKGKDDNGDDYE